MSDDICEALERIGVSESMRKMHRDTSISTEIIETISNRMTGVPESVYRLGSSCEGTTTPDMGSDVDVVSCKECVPVIEDIRDAPPDESFLAVTSTYTSPGYVKLQGVMDGTPLTSCNYELSEIYGQYDSEGMFTIYNYDSDDYGLQYDYEGRVCLKHLSHIGIDERVNERNGPADTIFYPGAPPFDSVLALRCKTFPQIGTDSLQKCIACGWISTDNVERMKRFGILFVGVGFPSSVDREVEWRMSFSLQERQLTLALNPTQHKCYVLLKTIKNLITAQPDVGKSLTSYHCKTCLFTVVTETSQALWTEDNIIKCTRICLSVLKSWICRGNCPNFFINQNNMFDRHEFRQVRERLLYYLREILHEWPRLLYHIESDHLGEALRGLAGIQIDEKRTKQVYDVLYRACERMCRCQNDILEHCHMLRSTQHITRYLFKQLCYLASIDTINDHTHEQTLIGLSQFEPFIHKLYAQQLASVAFSTENPASRCRLLETSIQHLKEGKTFDVMSGKLLEATILFRMGNILSCRDMLEQIERQIMHGAVVSLCKCNRNAHSGNYTLLRNVSAGYTNHQNIMKSAMATCVTFLPSQSEIIPKALQLEMYRSVFASPESRDEHNSKWFDFAVVDSKIFLYFLQYLVYSDLNQPIAQKVAIDQMWKMLEDDPNLEHIETAYNLLGWIYIQEGQLQEAVACLCHSWQIRPDHNAAKWHILALLMRQGGLQ